MCVCAKLFEKASMTLTRFLGTTNGAHDKRSGLHMPVWEPWETIYYRGRLSVTNFSQAERNLVPEAVVQ